MQSHLANFTLRGFKTIRKLENFEFGPLTVLIGPNGAGKSNLLSFFRLLSRTIQNSGNLQTHIAECGGASAILYDGASKTRKLDFEISIETESGKNEYGWHLTHAANDTLIFSEEIYRSWKNKDKKQSWICLESGNREPKLCERAIEKDKTASIIWNFLREIIVYQFHNTSSTARVLNKWHRDDNKRLKEDAANLAPFLWRLRQNDPKHYNRIVENIRLVLPFFSDFVLEPDFDYLLLQWTERNSDVVFSASQAADGMIRAMALIALLLQPEDDLPDVIILDEPELGLHPYAISIIAGLIRAASKHVQVIMATQSVSLIDYFEPEEIVVVEREGRESIFKRLKAEDLKDWLDEYTISELWEKNIVGGRPK